MNKSLTLFIVGLLTLQCYGQTMSQRLSDLRRQNSLLTTENEKLKKEIKQFKYIDIKYNDLLKEVKLLREQVKQLEAIFDEQTNKEIEAKREKGKVKEKVRREKVILINDIPCKDISKQQVQIFTHLSALRKIIDNKGSTLAQVSRATKERYALLSNLNINGWYGSISKIESNKDNIDIYINCKIYDNEILFFAKISQKDDKSLHTKISNMILTEGQFVKYSGKKETKKGSSNFFLKMIEPITVK